MCIYLNNKSVESVEHDGKLFVEFNEIIKYTKLKKRNNSERSYTSFSGILRDQDQYSSTGNYLNFNRLNVESWSVKMDSNGIPKNSFRWGEYYYPITIAHYAMQNYCRLIDYNHIQCYDGEGVVRSDYHSGEIKTIPSDKSTGFFFSDINHFEDLSILGKEDFRVFVDLLEEDQIFKFCLYPGSQRKLINDVNYIPVKPNIRHSINDIVSGVGKGFSSSKCTLKVKGRVTVFGLFNQYRESFLRCCDWFLTEQTTKGAWPSYFDHMFYKGRTELMKSGWSSALGQGLIISCLVRAYHLTKKGIYLESANKALAPFETTVEQGGVLRLWNNSNKFYEEYPTEPASFVLNGFIFSLIGLYDLYKIANNKKAKELFEEGMNTLEILLPLYDLGSCSAYDLTHYTCGAGFPNIARDGYHATHIHQLKLLTSISSSRLIRETHERWVKYTNGFSVPTN